MTICRASSHMRYMRFLGEGGTERQRKQSSVANALKKKDDHLIDHFRIRKKV